MILMQEQRIEASTRLEQPEREEKSEVDLLKIRKFIENADMKDLFLVSKFYFTGKPTPNDVNCFATTQLYSILKTKFKITCCETMRKKLDRLVNVGILIKIGGSPKIYAAVENKNLVQVIRNLVRQNSSDLRETSNKIFKSDIV